MSACPVLLDVIFWPFFLIGGLSIALVVALVVVVVAVTVGIIKRRKDKK